MGLTLRGALLAMAFPMMAAATIGSSAAAGQSDAAAPGSRHLYSETANPTADIAAAETVAKREKKRILLQFGGNWCGDCVILDGYYHQAPNAELIAKYYVLVHVDIGHMDHNIDVATKYHVPVQRGVPALAVLDDRGNLLYSEHAKEFEHTSPEAVATLLNHWKA